MNGGVTQQGMSSSGDSLPTSPRIHLRAPRRASRIGPILLGSLASLIFASSALGATATVDLGTAAPFSVLGGSTVTNTGPTTMSGDLGLYPGTAVTGAPLVLGQTYVNDQVAIEAKNSLTTAYTDAQGRPASGSAGTQLAGQEFSAGVYDASESLLLSSGSVTLNAEGDPNAVFIFQIGSTLTTAANTSVSLVGGAQACNVFWEVGSSATLGSGTSFVGTIMAADSITANTGATIQGRLLAQTAAVTLEENTITTATCASSAGESGAGSETTTGDETTAPAKTRAGTAVGVAAPLPIASRSTATHEKRNSALKAAARKAAARKAAARKAAARKEAERKAAARKAAAREDTGGHSPARPALPHRTGSFTG